MEPAADPPDAPGVAEELDVDSSNDDSEGGDAARREGGSGKKKRKRCKAMVKKPEAVPADLPIFNVRDLLERTRTLGYVPTLVSVFFRDDPDGIHRWCLLCRSVQAKGEGNQVRPVYFSPAVCQVYQCELPRSWSLSLCRICLLISHVILTGTHLSGR